MTLLKINAIPSPFAEHPTSDSINLDASGFHILSTDTVNNEGQFDLSLYANALLEKLLEFRKSKLKPFIEFHCALVQDPVCWLNKLEKLIELNYNQFSEEQPRIHKLYAVIETLREKEQNLKSEEKEFDFKKLKKQLLFLGSTIEKHALLIEAKTDLLQSNILNHSEPNEKNIKLIELEIQKIEEIKKLQANSGLQDQVQTSLTLDRLRFNCNINQFVDMFYNLQNDIYIDGKPILEGTPEQITDILVKCFLDKEGRPLSPKTVKTILYPSKEEKRPKSDSRLPVEKYFL